MQINQIKLNCEKIQYIVLYWTAEIIKMFPFNKVEKCTGKMYKKAGSRKKFDHKETYT